MLVVGSTAHAQTVTQPVDHARSAPARQPAFFNSWTHFGRTPAHTSSTTPNRNPIPPLDTPAFVVSQDNLSNTIHWVGPTGVLVHRNAVYGLGVIAGVEHAIRCDRSTGQVIWTAPLPQLVFDSWSTPAIDANNNTLLAAISSELRALDLNTGAQVWSAALDNPVVNASPIVTTDLGNADRAFITDSSFAGTGNGRLYCVNVDPFDSIFNPHQPGDLIWTVDLAGATSGNTPAHAAGMVFVSTADGRVLALDARAQTTPQPAWSFTNPHGSGYFAGVSVRAGSVYAASYGFNSTQLNSNLVKLDAHTGAPIWSAPSNRTDSIPIPLADGRVVLSAGLRPDPVFGDFGSRPSVALYAPDGALLVETALDTWIDANTDGVIDAGEYTPLGGWTHLPIVMEHPAGDRLIVGTLPEILPGGSYVEPYDRISIIDLGWLPGNDPADLVLEQFDGCGSTPALTGGWLYTIGPDGLCGFAP